MEKNQEILFHSIPLDSTRFHSIPLDSSQPLFHSIPLDSTRFLLIPLNPFSTFGVWRVGREDREGVWMDNMSGWYLLETTGSHWNVIAQARLSL
jgi:hypothetical protein